MSAAARSAPDGRCETCGRAPAVADIEIRPGPGADPTLRDDAVSVALRQPHRLLEPLGRALRSAQPVAARTFAPSASGVSGVPPCSAIQA